MTLTAVDIGDLAAIACPGDDADHAQLHRALQAVGKAAAWFEAQRLRCTRLLSRVDAFAEVTATELTHTNARDQHLLKERNTTLDEASDFALALESGTINTGHLDELSRSRRRLGDQQFGSLMDDQVRLLTFAQSTTPQRFADELRRAEQALAPDAGMDRLQRQRRAVRLWERVDAHDGMHVFTLRLDPLSGVKLTQQLAAATEALFHDRHPDDAPGSSVERQAFLRAHALLALLEGSGTRPGRPEIVVVVDTRTPDMPTIDWGADADIPDAALAEIAQRAVVRVIGQTPAGLPFGPGRMDLGRSTRLAGAAQRRVLRGLYPRCAYPGCTAPFQRCTVHHVDWWRNGGSTDLSNLLPLCYEHHRDVHTRRFHLQLAADRTLTVTRLADGPTQAGCSPGPQTMTTGPPARRPP